MKPIYYRNKDNTAVKVCDQCKLGGWHLYNGTNAQIHLQLFDALLANVTVGSTTPKMVLCIPAGQQVSMISSQDGAEFETALIMAATTQDDNNTGPTYDTSLATGDFTLFIW